MKLSVAMITYNQQEFIAQAIESVLMQQVDFEYEIVVGDDASTDRTGAIVRKYAERYPGRVHILSRGQNLGPLRNLIDVYLSCTGKYIALLDGDDYWTSSDKLQMQVDFLDRNPDFSACFHPVEMIYEGDTRPNEIGLPPGDKDVYTLDDLMGWCIPNTGSVVFRNGLFGEFPPWFHSVDHGDWPLYVLNACYGKFGNLHLPMSCYRIHAKGFWSGKDNTQRLQGIIQNYKVVGSHLPVKYRRKLNRAISGRFLSLANEHAKRGENCETRGA